MTTSCSLRWSVLLVVLAGLLTGVAARAETEAGSTGQPGRLVIVGGALDPQHEAIYRAFLEGVDESAKVGVVPLASGVPERSGPLTVQDIQQYTATPARVFDTKLTNNRPADAGTRVMAKRLAECGALWFTGGDQSRITNAMRPRRGDTPSYQAVLSILKRDGTIGGTSAGAAMMSRHMITGGSSRDAMLLGASKGYDTPGVGYGQGMALLPHGLVDQHFLRRGRFGRLLVATGHLDERFGIGISENRALAVELDTQTAVAVGDEAVTLIDLKDATHGNHRWSNVRVGLLSNGDGLDLKTGTITPAPERVALDPAAAPTLPGLDFHSVWDPYVIQHMLRALALNPGQPVTSSDGTFDFRMTADDQTRFYAAPSDAAPALTAVNVRLDITPRDNLKQRIAERRKQLAEQN
ncbi:MAG: cyanophycinase [Planctomycetota bacterium]